MPAKLIIHVPEQAATTRVLADGETLSLGRGDEVDVTIAHGSVSRAHARLAREEGSWWLTDLGSKNGVRVDGQRVQRANLDRVHWFALGDVFCEFETIDAAGVERLRAQANARRHSSAALGARLTRQRAPEDLLRELLTGIVELAECRRGFLLVGDGREALRVRACHDMDPQEIATREFSGSRGAVERTVTERRAVYLSERRDAAWLKAQASVVRRGIRALACLPLMSEGRLLGVVYVDTDDDAKIFTDLDVELLEAFVQQAATALAAIELEDSLRHVEARLHDAARRGVTAAPAWRDLAGAPAP